MGLIAAVLVRGTSRRVAAAGGVDAGWTGVRPAALSLGEMQT